MNRIDEQKLFDDGLSVCDVTVMMIEKMGGIVLWTRFGVWGADLEKPMDVGSTTGKDIDEVVRKLYNRWKMANEDIL